jgi:hypothetical protein
MRAVDIFGIAAAAMIALLSQIVEPYSGFWWTAICLSGVFVVATGAHILYNLPNSTRALRGAKLVTLGQSIIIGTGILSIIGVSIGLALIIIGDRQNAADHSAKVNAVVEAAKKVVDVITATTPPIVKPEERIFAPPELTPERLLSFYQDNTAIQAAERTKHYIGQWMTITGTLRNVSAPPGRSFAQVTFEKNYTPPLTWFDYTDTYCLFREPHIDRLKILKRGDKISVIGRISTIDPVSLNLDNCEFKYPPA